jgi:hypothetical protein
VAEFLLGTYGWPDWAVFWAFALACAKGDIADTKLMLSWVVERLEASQMSDERKQGALNLIIYHAMCIAAAENQIHILNIMALDFKTSMSVFVAMLRDERRRSGDPQRRAQIEAILPDVEYARQHQIAVGD